MSLSYKIDRWIFEKYKEMKLQEIKSEIEKSFSNNEKQIV